MLIRLYTFERSQLGVQIGPLNIAVTGVADDLYLLTNSQSKLQSLINIAEHYGQRYKSKFGAEKTKITVIGSEIDEKHFLETAPWTMGGKSVKVSENNEHLGQIVSGRNQIMKNVDQSISRGRKSLFALLGPAFAYKCLLGPLVKIHLFRTFTCPRLRSGLSAFALRSNQISPLAIFHRKTLKGILNLSQTAPTPAIHFLLGELPMEEKIHRDMFSLFFGVWTNPELQIYQLVKFLLQNSAKNSNTWAINMRHICQMYGIEDPLVSLEKVPPPKSCFKEIVSTKIIAFRERELKLGAENNSKMTFLNVNLSSLRGRHHPCLSDIVTPTEVKKLRLHLKFLTGDYLTFHAKAKHNKSNDSKCKLFPENDETIEHIIASCKLYSEIRERIWTQMMSVCLESDVHSELQKKGLNDARSKAQFLFDPTSFNLSIRININDKIVPQLFALSRDLCFGIHNERLRKLISLNL